MVLTSRPHIMKMTVFMQKSLDARLFIPSHRRKWHQKRKVTVFTTITLVRKLKSSINIWIVKYSQIRTSTVVKRNRIAWDTLKKEIIQTIVPTIMLVMEDGVRTQVLVILNVVDIITTAAAVQAGVEE